MRPISRAWNSTSMAASDKSESLRWGWPMPEGVHPFRVERWRFSAKEDSFRTSMGKPDSIQLALFRLNLCKETTPITPPAFVQRLNLREHFESSRRTQCESWIDLRSTTSYVSTA